jgi:hypothetical protein
VLDAPETSCSYSCGVCAGWHVCGGGGRAGHCGEGAEEFGQKGHGEVEKDGEKCEVDGANGCGICRESAEGGGVVYLIWGFGFGFGFGFDRCLESVDDAVMER